MKAKKLFPDLSFKRLWNKIKELENKVGEGSDINLDELNKKIVTYNEADDCLYINGIKWKTADLLYKYLYKDGVVHEETGNFYCYETGNENGVKGGGTTVNSTHLYGYTTAGNSNLRFCTNSPIDISFYSKLYIEYEITAHISGAQSTYDSAWIAIGDNRDGANLLNEQINSEIGTYIVNIDLSSITQTRVYITFLTNWVGGVKLTKLWLEK